ncbi:MAG: hypothetical protein COW01_01615 [Bdellovibrionales bacterium CG12_big_fil_rev_8_21_14_0_65_38_15]|nr:MAG: hypothetical protein COW79_00165 [Bdellovibrionales bacterium CG22_combo_CG10-13_8_21_14_all_38_13]PIQ57169.1 MAG: hypothetical protein COW01_01615 [Bdellovibrionales bacterium CG12_big_fil_rev_8_21_14_0_65_38_15]PIR31363.1 MAG: hypothetical protein COV38_00705 [Bdellovibrionales bacterium CG11_big_fil_rev_8_21_14_0_20_38_13]
MAQKVLVLISEPPLPATSGPKVRNAALWQEFKDLNLDIKIFSIIQANSEPPTRVFTDYEVQYFKKDNHPLLIRLWRYLNFSHHQYLSSKTMTKAVEDCLNDWKPDIIHAEELKMASFLPSNTKQCKTTLTVHNVESELIKQTGTLTVPFFQSLINIWHAIRLKSYERKSIQNSNLTFAYSKIDEARLKKLYPQANITDTSNGAKVKKIEPTKPKNSKGVLFVGSLHYVPNFEGIMWFIEKSLPHISKDISLSVAGAGAPEKIKTFLREKNITFYDTPESLEDLYHENAIAIVPVLKGSGTRTKIFEALAYQRLVVSTSLGAEGIPISQEDGLILCDDPVSFAQQINYWCDPFKEKEYDHISTNARKAALEFDWSEVANKLLTEWRSL